MLRSLLVLCCCMQIGLLSAQTAISIGRRGDSLYNAQQYRSAIGQYLIAYELADFDGLKGEIQYNLACCQGLLGNKDSALLHLANAIKHGYNNKEHIQSDGDLVILHNDTRWANLLNTIQPTQQILNQDPNKIVFHTQDIENFWNSYDIALSRSTFTKPVFKEGYFDKASKGMKDYMSLKVGSIDQFVQHIRSAPRYYAAIRNNTLQLTKEKKNLTAIFQRMKDLFPSAVFPDLYFVIGAFTSAGTVSPAGLLLGVNQMTADMHTPLDELSFQQRTRISQADALPHIIAHELVHYQQDGMHSDTTTLSYVIREGMADFIGELISDGYPNPGLYAWAKGKEGSIWEKFTKDMYFDRYFNWLANAATSTPDDLPDQGYWIGYQICKAYYDLASDKKAAIHDMLHIQDYRKFLADSKWEERLTLIVDKQ